jgi:hypothetical protein
MWIIKTLTAVTLVMFLGTATVHAQEHPEHPTKAKEKTEAAISIAELADAIEQYVADDAKLKGGYFMVYDTVQDKTLELTLAKVHKDKLASLGNDVYFACADFNSSDGHLYDLDIFMEDTDDGLKVSDIGIHKLDGQPRYTWIEKDGKWEKEDSKE